MLAVEAIEALRERGVVNPEGLVEERGVAAVIEACRWYDDQRGRVGAGMLVKAVHDPSVSDGPHSSKSLLVRDRKYGELIVAWLREHFPEFNTERESHPAAIAAVCRLHQRYGKGKLTVSEHGSQIRAAVTRFNQELL